MFWGAFWTIHASRLRKPWHPNLNFLNIYDGGQSYTEQGNRGWLSDAGFEGFERVLLPNGTSIVWAQKAASNS